MKLTDRYILREMFVPFLIGQGAIVMMLTGTVLYNNANVLLMNKVPVVYVVKMVLYFLPFLVHMTMPVAMAVAASLAISRLGRDSEITVMRASGMSLMRIFRVVFLAGLLVSVGDFWFGEKIVPLAAHKFDATLQEMVMVLPRMTPTPGQYIVSNDQSYAVYVKSMAPQSGYVELSGVQIVVSPRETMSGKTEPMLVWAERGQFRAGEWVLDRPFIIRYSLDGREYQVQKPAQGSKFRLYAAVDPQAFQSSFLLQIPMYTLFSAARKTYTQLGEDVARNRKMRLNDPFTLLDYHFKASIPFSCLVMAVCCAPLAFRFARGGGFMGTLLSICLVFVYWNTLLLMRILGSPGPDGGTPLLSPVLAAWAQNVVFALGGLWVMRRSE